MAVLDDGVTIMGDSTALMAITTDLPLSSHQLSKVIQRKV